MWIWSRLHLFALLTFTFERIECVANFDKLSRVMSCAFTIVILMFKVGHEASVYIYCFLPLVKPNLFIHPSSCCCGNFSHVKFGRSRFLSKLQILTVSGGLFQNTSNCTKAANVLSV